MFLAWFIPVIVVISFIIIILIFVLVKKEKTKSKSTYVCEESYKELSKTNQETDQDKWEKSVINKIINPSNSIGNYPYEYEDIIAINEIKRDEAAKWAVQHIDCLIQELIKNKLNNKGETYTNFTFYYDKQWPPKSCDIDNLVVTKAGIFIIEVKYWVGRISGNDKDEYWLQEYDDPNKEDVKHHNPIWQNEKHVEHFKNIWKVFTNKNQKIFNFVILHPNKIPQEGVFTISEAIEYIYEKSINGNENIEGINNIIKKIQKIYSCPLEEHMKYINRLEQKHKS